MNAGRPTAFLADVGLCAEAATPGESGPSIPCQTRRAGFAAQLTVVAVKRRRR